MRWSLRNQIFVPFSLLMVIVLTIVSGTNAYLAARRLSRQLSEQLEQIAGVVQGSSFPLTEAVLQQARELSGAHFVLTQANGELAATTVTPELPAADVRQLVSSAPADDRVTLAGRRYVRLHVPMGRRTELPQGGRLDVLFDEQALRDARWRAAMPPLIVGIASVVLVGIVAGAIAGRLSRPIVRLQSSVARLAGGHFEPLELPPRDDEIRDLVGSVNRVVGELRVLQQAMQRSERLALLGQLSGGLAHHLRNAMTGAKLALQLHQRHCRQADPSSLEVALRQLQLTEDHLQQLLTVGQPHEPRREECDLRAILSEVEHLLGPMARHRKVQLSRSAAETDRFPLVADAGQLRQAIVNLVVNAIEAVGDGGWVRLELSTTSDAQYVLRVSDSGPGPPDAIRARLFEPFTTGKPEGVGLGLAVARQVAQQHGGQLDLTARAPTCFELRLPAPSRPAATPTSTASPTDPPLEPQNGNA